MSIRDTYISEIQSMVQDSASKLTTTAGGDIDRILTKAIADYAIARPFMVRVKIQGNGSDSYLLLGGDGILKDLWQHGFSTISEIEYPTGSRPKEVIDRPFYELYDDGTAQDGSNIALRFNDTLIQTSEYFIVEFTIERSIPADEDAVQNFPSTAEHFSNITTLAAAYACQRLAAAYAQSIDATIGADAVNYNDKSSKYQSLAKQYMRQYNVSVFGSEDPVSSVSPSMVTRRIDSVDSFGQERIFHNRRRPWQ
jgi:hypothetical protein